MTREATMTLEEEKIDLKKQFPAYYQAKRIPQEVNLSEHICLAITGIGSPESDTFLKSIGALYPVAFALKKFAKSDGLDFKVSNLEAFWWVEDGLVFDQSTKNDWQWQLMIRMPEFVTADMVDQAVEFIIHSKNTPLANEVQLKQIHEGHCVQMMHIGSYYKEEETIGQIMKYIAENGSTLNGYHHEIYISDPRKTAEEKLKTIIRYAVR